MLKKWVDPLTFCLSETNQWQQWPESTLLSRYKALQACYSQRLCGSSPQSIGCFACLSAPKFQPNEVVVANMGPWRTCPWSEILRSSVLSLSVPRHLCGVVSISVWLAVSHLNLGVVASFGNARKLIPISVTVEIPHCSLPPMPIKGPLGKLAEQRCGTLNDYIVWRKLSTLWETLVWGLILP